MRGREKEREERERLKARYRELLQKWKPYLEGVELRRLSTAHALFFLENSLLEPEQTLRAIEVDDMNPMVRNPIGTLFSFLPMRSKLRDLWLLKLEPVKEFSPSPRQSPYPEIWSGFEWQSRWQKKWELAQKVLNEHGIEYTPPRDPESEEEAVEILRECELQIAKALFSRLSEEERQEIEERYAGYRENEELYEALIMKTVFERLQIPRLNFFTD